MTEDFVFRRFAVRDRGNGAIDQHIEIGFYVCEADEVWMPAQNGWFADRHGKGVAAKAERARAGA
ncbi:MAG: hypothetical protein ACK4XK_14240 [Casimicrobiaceae bacterium]